MKKKDVKKRLEKNIKKLSLKKRLQIKKRKDAIEYDQILMLGSCFLTLILFALIIIYLQAPTITLKGENEIIINYNQKYKEKGFRASYFNHDITNNVKITGEVNEKKLGKYKITYQVKHGPFTTKVRRTVIVSDIKKPKIILSGEKKVYVCPDKEYKEIGYKAIDNYDDNLTKKVKIKKLRNKVIYSVRDKSHNYTKETRKIYYKDIEEPKIELIGGDIVYAFVGSQFQDPGIKAIDNCDGDLTDKVVIDGHVDTDNAGNYKLTYKVTDSKGNKAEAKRTVIVARHGEVGTIYLTFDDGPKDGTTNIILDILRDNGVKATFFVTNNGPDELIKREFDEGHTVALHTATHNYSYLYSSADAYFEDLASVHDRVQRIIGQDTKIIRFPGGSSNTVSRKYQNGLMSFLTEEVLKRGYRFHDWNINSGDAGELNEADAIYENVIRQFSKDRVNVVLMHDIKPYTRDALDRIIKFGKENGYIFDKITMDTEMTRQKVNN